MKMKNFLKCCEDLVIQESGASAFELEKLKARQFPQAHLDLLSMTNGLEFYGGYYRLFGTDSTQAITLDSWNSDEVWKAERVNSPCASLPAAIRSSFVSSMP